MRFLTVGYQIVKLFLGAWHSPNTRHSFTSVHRTSNVFEHLSVPMGSFRGFHIMKMAFSFKHDRTCAIIIPFNIIWVCLRKTNAEWPKIQRNFSSKQTIQTNKNKQTMTTITTTTSTTRKTMTTRLTSNN